MYNNKKIEIKLSKRIIEDLNINKKNITCIEIIKEENMMKIVLMKQMIFINMA